VGFVDNDAIELINGRWLIAHKVDSRAVSGNRRVRS
jgi:hypothetical protein